MGIVPELKGYPTLANIFRLSPRKLEELYRKSDPGAIPRGETAGKASFNPGSILSPIEELLVFGRRDHMRHGAVGALCREASHQFERIPGARARQGHSSAALIAAGVRSCLETNPRAPASCASCS